MYKILTAFAFLSSISFISRAQVTPQPSPGAGFSQTIGISEVNVEYSRPGVKGRSIFGGLLPYGKIWRTGANASTKITFSSDVRINEMPLSAGTYSIMTIPGEESWVLIFSSDLEVTEASYSNRHDVLRLVVKPFKTDFKETFTIGFTEVYEDNATLGFSWEYTGIKVNVSVDNEKTIVSAIEARNTETAGAFLQAAEYLVNRDLDQGKALEYIDKSISLKETFRNTWIKSILMRKMGKYNEALKLAYKARQLGENDPVYQFFAEAIDQAIEELKEN
ncbi:DUF2911 domain-containing protein [Jiulongibacter sediminis]|uniref:DUF2911 domain-containing protein n=1 Tax=Jiulongibacter sediminis TaxID=1605367 RepID=UPI0026F0B9D4|nr:DUF2911 domain-containing protein [Jiulongibacter sediminis]